MGIVVTNNKTTPQYREIRIQTASTDRTVLIVTFVNDDLRSPQRIRSLESELLLLATTISEKRIVVDFSNVKIVPTAIFGIVLQLVADMKKVGGEVRVCCLNKTIRRAFDLLNSTGLVGVFDRCTQAIRTPWHNSGKGKSAKPWWKPFG